MGDTKQAQKVLARFHRRTAGFSPQEGEAFSGSQKRNIPKNYPYDPRSLKPLSKSLFATSVALGHVLAAHKHFSQVKSPAVSPDGHIGGRGYIMSMNEIRRKLWEASEALSAVSDALHDEINAPHWKPKLAQLDENDAEDVSRFVEEAQNVLDNPEEEAEKKIDRIEKENDGEGSGSEMPQGGASEPTPQVGEDPTRMTKEASNASKLLQGLLDEQEGGPRVDSRDPGEGTGPGGSWNPQEDATSDSWGYGDAHDGEYDYPSSWDNDTREASRGAPTVDEIEEWWEYMPPGSQRSLTRELKLTGPQRRWNARDWEKVMDYYVRIEEGDPRGYNRGRNVAAEAQKWAESALPSDPDTPTDGRDFGLGYGAKGEAEERAGEWGPHADLPGSPWQAVGDTTPDIDVNLNERHGLNSLLPGDESESVARMDYYRGDRGNLVNTGSGSVSDEEDLGFIDTSYVYDDLDTDRLPNGEATLYDVR